MNILQFQQKAIEELLSKFKILWNKKENTELLLKAPTGSGKTYMTTSFINRLNDQPDWINENVAFFWITFSDDLTMQSRDKFREYFAGNLKNQLLTTQDFNQGKLNKNDVLFTNWQKLVSKDATKRLLRRPTDERELKESGFYFEDIIENTQNDNRNIILIIDECHKNNTDAANRDVINKINPKLTLKISATPFNTKKEEDDFYAKKGRELADIVEVSRDDVVNEGLIKSKIICQTEEELLTHNSSDSDKLMLNLAIEKREKIAQEWKHLGLNINPLVLIQLPNDDSELEKEGATTKETIVRSYLDEKGIDSNKIGSWFAGKDSKNNLEGITDNDSPVEYLLFKVAAGTGWDCPRAHILVMFREIKNPTFQTQTLGRILRMPYINKDFNNDLLTTGYLYTNHPRNKVGIPDQDSTNKPKIYTTEVTPKLKKVFIENFIKAEIDAAIKNSNKLTSSNNAKKIFFDKLKEIIHNQLIDLPILTDLVKKNPYILEKQSKEINSIVNTLKTDTKEIIAKTSFSNESDKKEIVHISNKIIEEINNVATNNKEVEIILDKELKTDFLSRSDYNDIGKVSLFQQNFIEFMNEFFGLNTEIFTLNSSILEQKGVELNKILTYKIMVNAIYHSEEQSVIDDLGKDINIEMSPNDVDKAFTWKCYQILKEQTEEDAKIGNVSRSWGALKGALIQWLTTYALNDFEREETYKIFLNDVNKPQSKIREAITYSLKKYKPIRNEYIQTKINADSAANTQVFTIKNHYAYSDDYEIYKSASKSLVQPFYLRKEYSGRLNETNFIELLENSDKVTNWFKNGDNGKEFLGFKYYSTIDECYSLFYPDWIVQTNNNQIYLLDTKSGQTASSTQTKDKAEELYRRIQELNKKSFFHYVGGIVIYENGLWYINNQEKYVYNSSHLEENGWTTLSWDNPPLE